MAVHSCGVCSKFRDGSARKRGKKAPARGCTTHTVSVLPSQRLGRFYSHFGMHRDKTRMEQQLQVVLHTKISSTHRKTEKNVEKMGETGAQGPLSSTGRWVAQKKTADNCLVAEFPVTASMSTVISTLDVSNVSNNCFVRRFLMRSFVERLGNAVLVRLCLGVLGGVSPGGCLSEFLSLRIDRIQCGVVVVDVVDVV